MIFEDGSESDFQLTFLFYYPKDDNVYYHPIVKFDGNSFDDSTKEEVLQNDFFKLFKIQTKDDHKQYLIKEYPHHDNNSTIFTVKDIDNLIVFQGSPVLLNIEGYLVFDEDPNQVKAIVYEYLSFYTFEELCETERKDKQPRNFNNTQKSLIMYEITNALSYMHALGVPHNHLNSNNILIDKETLHVKLIDYELSDDAHQKEFSGIYYKQLPYYTPPPIPEDYKMEDQPNEQEEDEPDFKKLISSGEEKEIKDSKAINHRYGDDSFALGLIYFEIATMMKKNRENDDDIKYISTNLRRIFKQMYHPIPNKRPRIVELLLLINNCNSILYDTNLAKLKDEIKRIEDLTFPNVYCGSRRDVLYDCEMARYADDFECSISAAAILFGFNSPPALYFLSRNLQHIQDTFSLTAISLCYSRGLCGADIKKEVGEVLFDIASSRHNSLITYRYCVGNFDCEYEEKQLPDGETEINIADDQTIWWQFQQLRSGIRDSSIYYDKDNHQQVYPQYKPQLKTVIKYFVTDCIGDGGLRQERSESCVAFSLIAQLPELPVNLTELALPLSVIGWEEYHTLSLALAVMIARQKKDDAHNEEYGKIGAIHNFNFMISDLSAFYYDRKRLDEAFHWAHKGALNSDPQCELILGLIYHDKGDNAQAKEFLTLAKEHGDSRAPSILARLFISQGENSDEAEKLLHDSKETSDKDFIVLYLRTKQYDKLASFIKSNMNNEQQSDFFNAIQEYDEYDKVLKACVEAEIPVAYHKYAINLINSNQEDDIIHKILNSNPQLILMLHMAQEQASAIIKQLVDGIRKKMFDEAKSYFEKAIEHDVTSSYFSLAQILHDYYHDDENAYKYAKLSSEKGDPFGTVLLGLFTMEGKGTEKDLDKGIELVLSTGDKTKVFYMKQHSQEIVQYYQRKGETEKALEVMKEGAEKYHDEYCCVSLGGYYMTHDMPNEAFKIFKESYERKKTRGSINNYGICYLNGVGTEKDWERAKEIFNEGLEMGDMNSMYHLAYIYEKEDPEKSLKLYEMAAEHGEIHAVQYLIEKYDKEGNTEKKEKYMEMYMNSCGNNFQYEYVVKK